MIQWLCPPTFFKIFTSAESKWLLLLKCLYDLKKIKLGFNIPFDKLKPKLVVDLITCDLITCAWYYDHCMKFFCTLCMKDNSIFGHLLDFFFVTKFSRCRVMSTTMDFYGLQMHQFMFWIQAMQLKAFWINIYHVIIIN
jgi:hypothetical protein